MDFNIKHICPLFVVLLMSLAACNDGKESYPPQHIVALYDIIDSFSSLDSMQRAEVLQNDSLLLRDYLSVLDCDRLDDSLLNVISLSRPVEVFTPDVRRVFPTLDSLEFALGHILGAASTRGLDFNTRQYAAVVWGRPQSVVFVDSTMLIALNHYLGSNYEGYSGMPQFRLSTKTPQHLPYDLAESLTANSYPFEAKEIPTLLNHILYDGALTMVKMRTVPQADLALSLGYTAEQMKWCDDNSANIWRTLVSGRLLYETSGFKIDRIMLPAPSTDLLSPNSPGRLGRYIGYRIVESYMKKHPDTSLTSLLSPEFYMGEKTLGESGYKP